MSERKKAMIALVASAILLSTAGLMVKWIDLNPLAITGIRGSIATAFLWIYLRKPQFTWSRAQLSGGFAYACTIICFISATKLTTASNAVLLQYTAPIYVALLSMWLLKEPVKLADWLAIGVILGGMVLFFLDSLSTKGLWGNILAILSSFTFAWFIIALRQQKQHSPMETVILGNLLALAVCLPFMFETVPDLRDWLVLFLFGTVQQGVAFVLFNYAIKRVSALETVLIATIEPILNPFWVLFLVGEVPGFWGIVGGAIVVFAVTTRGALAAKR